MNARPVAPSEVEPERVRVGDFLGLEDGDHDADDHGSDHREDPDRRVLTTDERDRALEDGPGNVLHLLGPGIPREDVPGEVDREQDGDDAGGQDDQLERTRIHQGFRLLLEWVDTAAIPARACVARRAGGLREMWLGSQGTCTLGWDLAGRRRV